MRVTVNLLGGLRHHRGGEETVVLDLDPAMTAGALAAHLGIPDAEVMQVLADGVGRRPDEALGHCSEVNVIPTLAAG